MEPTDRSLGDDEAALAGYALDLADALAETVPGWIAGCVLRRAREAGVVDVATVEAAGRRAHDAACDTVVPRLRDLLGTDIDEQRTNPLSVVRAGVRCATDELRALGVPPLRREAFERDAFPDDDYDLAPATFADIDERLHEPGLRWGAAKAHVHLARRRAEGRR